MTTVDPNESTEIVHHTPAGKITYTFTPAVHAWLGLEGFSWVARGGWSAMGFAKAKDANAALDEILRRHGHLIPGVEMEDPRRELLEDMQRDYMDSDLDSTVHSFLERIIDLIPLPEPHRPPSINEARGAAIKDFLNFVQVTRGIDLMDINDPDGLPEGPDRIADLVTEYLEIHHAEDQ